MDINKIAVIGGGTMGNGIAHVFALNGLAEISEYGALQCSQCW